MECTSWRRCLGHTCREAITTYLWPLVLPGQKESVLQLQKEEEAQQQRPCLGPRDLSSPQQKLRSCSEEISQKRERRNIFLYFHGSQSPFNYLELPTVLWGQPHVLPHMLVPHEALTQGDLYLISTSPSSRLSRASGFKLGTPRETIRTGQELCVHQSKRTQNEADQPNSHGRRSTPWARCLLRGQRHHISSMNSEWFRPKFQTIQLSLGWLI